MNNKHIHLAGIGGIAMGALACMLKEKGYHITGSDAGVYPPMSDILRNAGIAYREGFAEENIRGADLVVVGNAISRGNPEVESVLNERVPYLSMAGALHEFFLKDKEVIAVCGTHGKTTTTALLAHILVEAGLDPSCFIGGNAINLGRNYRLGEGKYFVIEGDEYDSAFFEKVPKFIFYRPHHCVLTSLEFDHADIYGSLDEIKLWFRRLVNMVPGRGNIVWSGRYDTLKEVTAASLSGLHSFGGPGAHITWDFHGYDDRGATLTLRHGGGSLELVTTLMGEFNFDNIAAAVGMALGLGVRGQDIAAAVRSFRGVKRRQEIIYRDGNILIYEDFAHHPTAIGYMLRTLRMRHPRAKIWAVYEPRSATSRRNVFQDELPGALEAADAVYMKTLFSPEKIPPEDRLDILKVRNDLDGRGRHAELHDTVDGIVSSIAASLDRSAENVIVIMSNGGFDGIYHKLPAALEREGEKNRN